VYFSLSVLRCGGVRVALVAGFLAYALGASVFPLYPVVSPGGCEPIWVVVLTDGVPLCCVTACSKFIHRGHCRVFLYC